MVTEVINGQYPHYLFRRATAADAVQTANGSWESNGNAWVYHSRCREETNGRGARLLTASGEYLTFSSLIQLPKGAQRIPEGVEVMVTDVEIDAEQLNDQDESVGITESAVRISGICLKFDNGRLHARLWV